MVLCTNDKILLQVLCDWFLSLFNSDFSFASSLCYQRRICGLLDN